MQMPSIPERIGWMRSKFGFEDSNKGGMVGVWFANDGMMEPHMELAICCQHASSMKLQTTETSCDMA